MSSLTTPKEGAFGTSSLLLCLWVGLDRTETPKGHSPPPSPKATSCKVQVGSEWGRCILSSAAWAGRGVLRRLTQKKQDSSQPAPITAQPHHGQKLRHWQSHQLGPPDSQFPCLSLCVCAHEAHTSVCTGVGVGV